MQCYFLPKKYSQWLASQLAECVPIHVLSISHLSPVGESDFVMSFESVLIQVQSNKPVNIFLQYHTLKESSVKTFILDTVGKSVCKVSSLMLQKYSISNGIFYGIFCSFSFRKKNLFFSCICAVKCMFFVVLFYCTVCSFFDSEDGLSKSTSSICNIFFIVSPLCV